MVSCRWGISERQKREGAWSPPWPASRYPVRITILESAGRALNSSRLPGKPAGDKEEPATLGTNFFFLFIAWILLRPLLNPKRLTIPGHGGHWDEEASTRS